MDLTSVSSLKSHPGPGGQRTSLSLSRANEEPRNCWPALSFIHSFHRVNIERLVCARHRTGSFLCIIHCDLHVLVRWQAVAPLLTESCPRGSWHAGTNTSPRGGAKQSAMHRDSHLGLSGSREVSPKDRDRWRFTGFRPSRTVLVSTVTPGTSYNRGVS